MGQGNAAAPAQSALTASPPEEENDEEESDESSDSGYLGCNMNSVYCGKFVTNQTFKSHGVRHARKNTMSLSDAPNQTLSQSNATTLH